MISQGSVDTEFYLLDRSAYAFVDADNIRRGLEDIFRRHKIKELVEDYFDMEKVIKCLDADRYFLYSAIEISRDAPPWIKSLRASSKIVFRPGVLVEKEGRRKQEGVDVLLALDAIGHAQKRNMKTCVVMSADGDMLPLVSALVSEGARTIVCNFSNPEKGDVAGRLRDAADDYWQIGSHLLKDCFRDKHANLGSTSLFRSDFDNKRFDDPLITEWQGKFVVNYEFGSEQQFAQTIFPTKAAAEVWSNLHSSPSEP